MFYDAELASKGRLMDLLLNFLITVDRICNEVSSSDSDLQSKVIDVRSRVIVLCEDIFDLAFSENGE